MWIVRALPFLLLQLISPALSDETTVIPWWEGGKYDIGTDSCPCCVSLRDENGHFATGVIIDENVIVSIQHHRLTAADEELNVTVVMGEDILAPADAANATVPRRIFLVKPDGPAQYTQEEDARIALWTLVEPLELNGTVKACPRFESTKNQDTPSTAIMKGWTLDRHGDHKEQSRNLKNYNVTALPMRECGDMPEDIYFCATMEPKEVNCFGRTGNPIFSRDGICSLGFRPLRIARVVIAL